MRPTQSGALASDLARLLEAEERLEARLARAGVEAAQIVATAREGAGAREEQLEAQVAEIERRLEAEAESERTRRVQDIETAARREIEAFDAVDEQKVAALAHHVVDRVIGEQE